MVKKKINCLEKDFSKVTIINQVLHMEKVNLFGTAAVAVRVIQLGSFRSGLEPPRTSQHCSTLQISASRASAASRPQ